MPETPTPNENEIRRVGRMVRLSERDLKDAADFRAWLESIRNGAASSEEERKGS